MVKKLYWYSTFGSIGIEELVFREGRRGKRQRPLSTSIGVQCRGYSKSLQRAMVDFGADVSFAAASRKLKEHYGIDIPSSSIRARTLHHSQRCFSLKEEQQSSREPSGVGVVILQSDGTMEPLVETADPTFRRDRRKTRQVSWKEGIISLAYARGRVDSIYAGTLNGRDEAGFQMNRPPFALWYVT